MQPELRAKVRVQIVNVIAWTEYAQGLKQQHVLESTDKKISRE